ncbi:MAG: VOC family protein [Acidimicrobiia bacterium]|nr:VOC family protein [Acidimicrobiia bacterium]
MSCRFTELIIDAEDPDGLAAFWQQVLGYEERDRDEDAIEIGGPPGTGPTLVFLRVPEPKTVKNRLHIDVNATDRDQAAELERLLALGARPVDVGQGDAVSWHVLADPEGNEFCLLARRVDAETAWPPA